MFISEAYAPGGRRLRRVAPTCWPAFAAGPHFRRVLVPDDPPAAEAHEGTPRPGRRARRRATRSSPMAASSASTKAVDGENDVEVEIAARRHVRVLRSAIQDAQPYDAAWARRQRLNAKAETQGAKPRTKAPTTPDHRTVTAAAHRRRLSTLNGWSIAAPSRTSRAICCSSPKFKITLILAVLLVGLYTALPNVFGEAHIAAPALVRAGPHREPRPRSAGRFCICLPKWTTRCFGEAASSTAVEDEMRRSLRQARLSADLVRAATTRVTVQAARPPASLAAREALEGRSRNRPAVQLDIADDGNVSIFFNDAEPYRTSRRRAVEQSIEVIRKRIDETGTKEPTIIRQGDDRIVVQVPGVKDPQGIKELIGKTAKMAFHMVDETAEVERPAGADRHGRPGAVNPKKDGSPSQSSGSCRSCRCSPART